MSEEVAQAEHIAELYEQRQRLLDELHKVEVERNAARAELKERADIDRILNAPDEEILAEARAEGVDTEEFAAEMRGKFDVIARLTRQNEKLRRMLGDSWTRHAAHTKRQQQERTALLAELAAARKVIAEIYDIADAPGEDIRATIDAYLEKEHPDAM